MMRLLFRPISSVAAVPVALLIGVGYGVFVFGLEFLDTSGPFWRLPEGYVGALIDPRLILSGYLWFVQDVWRWPLLNFAQVNRPFGMNAALMDVIPVLALGAKLAVGVFGTFNPFPAWIVGCFGLNAAALSALVRGLGQRSLVASVAAGALGAMAPLMHLRFGHFALGAHWTFILALAVYASHVSGRLSMRNAGVAVVGLAIVAFATTIYLYVMVAAIGGALFLQALIDKRLGWAGCAAWLISLLAAAAIPLWSFGLVGRADLAAETVPFGYASMNLVSPFWPQSSGLFAWTGIYALTRGSIGAHAGQYDGSSYLGGGILVLVLASLLQVRRAASLPGLQWRRHAALAAALAVLSMWAASNRIYAGPVLVLAYPVPAFLERTLFAWFRFEGRFFWPVAWLLCGLAVAGTLTLYRPRVAGTLLALALLLQWADLSIWRERLHALVHKPPISAFGSLDASSVVEAEVWRRGSARVVPALHCNAVQGSITALPVIAGIELQLMAGRRNAAMATVLAARNSIDCAAERATPIGMLAGDGLLLVLSDQGALDRTAEAREVLDCVETTPGLLCVARGGSGGAQWGGLRERIGLHESERTVPPGRGGGASPR